LRGAWRGHIRAALDRLDDLSEAQMREAIAGLPDGIYEGEDFLDDDGPGGSPRPSACASRSQATGRASISAAPTMRSRARSTPRRSSPWRPSTTPSRRWPGRRSSPTAAAIARCSRHAAGLDLDPGIDKPVVGGNHETSQRAVDAIMRAFAHAVPERLTAGGSTTAGLLIFGGTRRDGATGTFYETHGGGEGARAERDGVPVVRVHLTNTMNTPAEIVEAEYMIRVEEQRLRRGSGGAGRHRGGEGMVRTYTVLADGLSLTTMFERRVVPPYGLMGGKAGAPFRVTLHRAAGGQPRAFGQGEPHPGRRRSRRHGDLRRRRLRHGLTSAVVI
jgi:N-methylhydantoinase B